MGFWARLKNQLAPAAAGGLGLRDLMARFTGPSGEAVDWEALFIEADLGFTLAEKWLKELEKRGLTRNLPEAEKWIAGELRTLATPPPLAPVVEKPEVVMLVGVNGGGKTTTAAKLAYQAKAAGRSVVLGAADTFRAAAVDQLQVWGDRIGVPVISAPPGTDPASVAFRTYEAAIAAGADLVIVDTAGRLPNKSNLMLELGKVKRTLQKKSPTAPHRTWLVADGTSGNNVLTQTKEFHAAVGLTGLILTKYDASAKGGMVAAVRAEFGVPTYFLGKGEGLDDLAPIDPDAYVRDFFAD
jgi:fused signal recognition particle receptor